VSIDAIAQQAGVARMTVYYQFKSRAGLIEALFDDHATRGGLTTALPAAFTIADPLAALDAAIAAFCHLWGSQRTVQRRLVAASTLDAELEAGLRAREERGRQALEVLVTRIADMMGRPEKSRIAEAVDVLHALTGFATFDRLARSRTESEVASLLSRTARSLLGLDVGEPGR
jgi:AcrR family transcriptional regulator